MKKRNGKIELLRFLFSVTVILFHSNTFYFGKNMLFGRFFGLAPNGYLAVEFFFIVSGFLMAKSALRPGGGKTLAADTTSFMGRKLKGIIPIHVIAYSTAFVTYCLFKQFGLRRSAVAFFSALPGFFLLNRTGAPMTEVLGIEWYISSMLIAMLLLYPLCRKLGPTFTDIIAGLVCIGTLGYLFFRYETLGGAKEFEVITFRTNIRAVGEICLGACCFSASEKIGKLDFSRADKVILTLLEPICFAFAFVFCFSRFNSKYSVLVLIALAVGTTLAFSGVTFGEKLFSGKLIYWLGRLSLPLYLMQYTVFYVFRRWFTGLSPAPLLLLSLASTVVCSILAERAAHFLGKALNAKIAKLKGTDPAKNS